MTRLRDAFAALRGFARGFLGLRATIETDRATARARLRDDASRRQHCC